MARRQSSKIQRSGEQYARERARNAMTTGIPDEPDPIVQPSEYSVAWGAAFSVVGLVMCLMLVMFNRSSDHGESTIMQTGAGGLYVALEDQQAGGERVLHPALNLASARLASGASENPTKVDDKTLEKYRRGLPIGIAAAPNNLDYHLPSETDSSWGVCNTNDDRSALSLTKVDSLRTTIVAGRDVWQGGKELGGNQALLVTTQDEPDTLYLVWGNQRAKLPNDNGAVWASLGIDAATAKKATPITKGLLNSMTARPTIMPPKLPRMGEQSEAVTGQKVGDVLTTTTADGERRFFVVANDGVQQINAAIADLLTSAAGAKLLSVNDAGELSAYPPSSAVAIANYPSRLPEIIQPGAVCSVWEQGVGENKATKRVVTGNGVPITAAANENAVALLESSGAPAAARYVAAPGKGWFVQITGDDESARERGQVAFIDDNGIRYNIIPGDGETYEQVLSALGLTGVPMAIPDSIARLLPQGADLSRRAAMQEHVYDRPGKTGEETEERETVTVTTEPNRSEEAESGGGSPSENESEAATKSSEAPTSNESPVPDAPAIEGQ